MSFHLGKPILVMIVVALVGSAAVALRPGQRKADLDIWVFAEGHHRAYVPIVERYERETGRTVNCNLVQFRALNVRLGSLFMSDPESPEVPDLVELEIGSVGRYFRPPTGAMGLIPLNDYLARSGWGEKLVKQRLAPWTKDGLIFGVPHDVHPVTITYRHDLWTEAGVDPTTAKTWAEFHALCERFKQYWRGKGFPYRHAIELPESDSGYVVAMLLQRGINLVDNENRIFLADPRVANTLATYAQMVAGPRAVAGQSSGGRGGAAKDLADGNLCSFITPDWRLTYFKIDAPQLAGRMRMMPLPVFEPGDAPTSTWGGTMIGIPRGCENPDEAWAMIERLYFSEQGLAERLRISNVLPPVRSLWDDPVFRRPDEFLGGQQAFQMFIDLTEHLPERHVTPASAVAQAELTYVLNKAVSHARRRGGDGLEQMCQVLLTERAESLARRMRHWSFDADERVEAVGSLPIADCQLPIEDKRPTSAVASNRQSAIDNRQSPSGGAR